MDNQENKNFIFGGDDNEPEFHDAVAMQRIEKLGQKVSFISLLIPCLIGIVIVFIYLDMKNKVDQVHSSGSTEIHKITTDLEKSISALQLKNTEMEKTIQTQIAGIEKSISKLSKSLKKAEKNIDYMISSKADKKSITPEIKGLRTQTESLGKSIEGLASQNKKLVQIAEKLQSRTAEISTLKTEIEKFEQYDAKIQSNIRDISELNNVLKKQKRFYRLEIEELSNRIDKKIKQLKTTTNSGSNSAP